MKTRIIGKNVRQFKLQKVILNTSRSLYFTFLTFFRTYTERFRWDAIFKTSENHTNFLQSVLLLQSKPKPDCQILSIANASRKKQSAWPS